MRPNAGDAMRSRCLSGPLVDNYLTKVRLNSGQLNRGTSRMVALLLYGSAATRCAVLLQAVTAVTDQFDGWFRPFFPVGFR